MLPYHIRKVASTPQLSPTENQDLSELDISSLTDSLSSGSISTAFEGLEVDEELQGMKKWIHAILVVVFDVQFGPNIQFCYPAVEFSQADQHNICFSAMPDTNSHSVDHSTFSFRYRSDHNQQFMNGFVYFRQDKDESMKRGCKQRSVVILTQHSYSGLFTTLSRMFEPFFSKGLYESIEAACHNMNTWPFDQEYIQVPFVHEIVDIEFPESLPQLRKTSKYSECILANSVEGQFFKTFHSIIDQAWLLWELVLFGEPILICATNPSLCSSAVLSLVDLIAPIKYGGDYRPYCTIQDKDFKSIFNSKASNGIIVGVTNKYFLHATEKWPTIIKLGKPNRMPSYKSSPVKGFLEFTEGLTTVHKRRILKDQNLLKKVLTSRQDPASINDTIRQHFAQLTYQFLRPFELYFETLVQPGQNALPSMKKISEFHADEFYLFLKSMKFNHIKTRRQIDWYKLYKKFFHSINFSSAVSLAEKNLKKRLRREYLVSISEFNVGDYLKNGSNHEIEVVDFLLHYKKEISKHDVQCGVNRDLYQPIHKRILEMFRLLSDDLKSSASHIIE